MIDDWGAAALFYSPEYASEVEPAIASYYCGRSNDMLKVGGIWCSPFEIESKILEHLAVVEAAAVGRANHESLIKPEAFVVLKDGQPVTPCAQRSSANSARAVSLPTNILVGSTL